MAELHPNCVLAPTPMPTPGVEGGGAATYTNPGLVCKFATNLTDWEFFMLKYRIRNYFTVTNSETDATTKVYVKDLPDYITEEDLMTMFSFFGRITNLVLMRDPTTSHMFKRSPRGKSKCCAYVYFVKLDDATKAVEALDGIKYDVDHKEWSVGIATKNKDESANAVDEYQSVEVLENLDVDKRKGMTKGSEAFSCSELVPSLMEGGTPTPNLPLPALQEGEKQLNQFNR